MSTNMNQSLSSIYEELKQKKNNDVEINKIIEMVESIANEPSEKKSEFLKLQVSNNQSKIESLSPQYQKALDYYVNQALFAGAKSNKAAMTKWEFFVDYASKQKWDKVLKAIELIDSNERRYLLGRTEMPKSSITDQEKALKLNKEDSDKLGKIINEEVFPWIESSNLSDYNKEWISNSLLAKKRVIENRIERTKVSDFALWLRTTRKEQGLSLRGLAEKANISYSYVSRLEAGSRAMPSMHVVESLSEALDINVDIIKDIVFGSESEKESLSEVVAKGNYLVGGMYPSEEFKENMVELIDVILKDTIELSDIGKVTDLLTTLNKTVKDGEE